MFVQLLKSAVICIALVFSESVLAQTSSVKINTNTSVLKVDSESPNQKKEKSADIDNKITDARMRAELGSKSKWSLKSRLNYSGGTVAEPFSKMTTNLRRTGQLESMSSISGDLGVNYRLSPSDSLGFGTGLTMVAPLQGLSDSVEDHRHGRDGNQARYQLTSPYVDWKKGYRVLDTMMMTSVRYVHATERDSVDLMKVFGRAMVHQQIMQNFGASKWTVGVGGFMAKMFYSAEIDDPKLTRAKQMGKLQRTDYVLGAMPFVQYTFNDRYSTRTEFGYFSFTKVEGSEAFEHEDPFQSIGVGISITRDIYLFPNVQFAVKELRADRTNVGMNANINLF